MCVLVTSYLTELCADFSDFTYDRNMRFNDFIFDRIMCVNTSIINRIICMSITSY